MPIINLRKHYYPLVTQDTFIEVSDEVAEALLALRRDEERIRSRIRYHKAYYSLDASEGMENHALNVESKSPEDVLMQKEGEAYQTLMVERLEKAFATLTPTQARRIRARFLEKKKFREIAEAEGISAGQANVSIQGAIRKMKKYFHKNGWKFEGD